MIARAMLVVVLLAAIGAAGTAHSQVYRWKDKHGKVHYGDDPSTAGATSLTNISPAPGLKRTDAPSSSAPQAQKQPQAKGERQQETEPKPRQAAQQR